MQILWLEANLGYFQLDGHTSSIETKLAATTLLPSNVWPFEDSARKVGTALGRSSSSD